MMGIHHVAYHQHLPMLEDNAKFYAAWDNTTFLFLTHVMLLSQILLNYPSLFRYYLLPLHNTQHEPKWNIIPTWEPADSSSLISTYLSCSKAFRAGVLIT
jgi:hypothetical protein